MAEFYGPMMHLRNSVGNFNAGYVMRGLDLMPRQGHRQAWLMMQEYFDDRETMAVADLDDGTLRHGPG